MRQNSETTLLSVLNFSGGQQSSALLWMVLRGELQKPENFAVLSADPGMENTHTYLYIEKMQKLCAGAEIEAVTVEGPSLFNDLLNLKASGSNRFDTPPYWTKSEQGKRGRLRQKCTAVYKISPMDRWIRKKLFSLHGIGLTNKRFSGHVEKWIGFSKDEEHRVSEPKQKYVKFRYPLIELGMTKKDVTDYFYSIGETPPPRSVCNACFANDVNTFRQMKKERPQDFAQALAIDEIIRDLSCIHVREEVYVSSTLLPLKDLIQEAKDTSDLEEWSCDSGYCFI